MLAAVNAEALDPLTTRWTFGAHEPYSMYRRMGKKSTGGIDGSAKWLGDWLDWWDEKVQFDSKCVDVPPFGLYQILDAAQKLWREATRGTNDASNLSKASLPIDSWTKIMYHFSCS